MARFIETRVSARGAPSTNPRAGDATGPARIFVDGMTLTVAERARRWTELTLLFGLAPLLASLMPRGFVLPTILAGGACSLVVLLRDRTFPRSHLGGIGALRGAGKALLLRALVVAAVLLLVAWWQPPPAGAFWLPRQHPVVWAGVLVLYPLLSVYPQELMYRALFFHRYGCLFPGRISALIANAALFGWGHIMVHHVSAMLLAAGGGLLFASTYLARRATVLVALEHALYGSIVLSVGVGGMFVNGVRLVTKMLG